VSLATQGAASHLPALALAVAPAAIALPAPQEAQARAPEAGREASPRLAALGLPLLL
jgi:hypothetical protein